MLCTLGLGVIDSPALSMLLPTLTAARSGSLRAE
jgi:hypothetical protein